MLDMFADDTTFFLVASEDEGLYRDGDRLTTG